jgi:TolB-like protein/tetratricopeptide (TPR) repeat protein
VLPFENLSQDADQDYFSDGLTEEMISRLGSIRPDRLGVIARSSIMRFKKGSHTAKDIGRDLRVDYILEGSVRRDGEHVRITTKLIQVKDESQLWTETYDRDLRDWINLQTEVAQTVGRQVQLTLNSRTPLRIETPIDVRAHEEYLRGRYQWNKRDKPGLTKAVGHFERAIQIDPLYARAYSGLADSYGLLSVYAPREETLAKAEAAARKALEIDPLLAEAHASLGLSAMNYRLSWQESEREYKRAIQIDPNYATAHHWYAESLSAQGRFDDALAEIERARELDPLSLIIATDTGKILCYARRYPEAIDWLRKVLAEDPTFSEAHLYLVQAYMNSGRLNEALAELDTFQDPDRPSGWFTDLRATVLAKLGRHAEARKIVEGLEQAAAKAGLRTFAFRSYVALGEFEKALAVIEEALERRNVPTNLKVDPVLDPLRRDARFNVAVKRMGL